MGIGTSIVFIAVGAILAFAVHVTNHSGIDINTVGWILMVVGLVGALLSMMYWSSWGGVGGYRQRETLVDRPGRTVVTERDVY